jgi:hypothetical protein
MQSYEVHVHTSNIKGAGTDANIFCILYGTEGDTGERQLKVRNNKIDYYQTTVNEGIED